MLTATMIKKWISIVLALRLHSKSDPNVFLKQIEVQVRTIDIHFLIIVAVNITLFMYHRGLGTYFQPYDFL